MTTFLAFLLLAILTMAPAVLFLLQYRAPQREPVAILLRGFVTVLMLRSLSTLILQAGGREEFDRLIALIPAWVIHLSAILQMASAGLLWGLYLMFLRYRKHPENGLR